MARSVEARIHPELLVWARESLGLDDASAAKRIGVPVEKLRAWERGEGAPTIAKLRKIADVYKRPLAVFYLAEPPTDFQAMRYFRRHPGTGQTPSPALTLEIRHALALREVAIEIEAVLGEGAPEFKGVARTKDSTVLADRMRTLIGVDLTRQAGWRNENEALREWRSAFEHAGILVYQFAGVPVTEARGLSVFDRRRPMILLNGKDSVRARCFTMFHELGHLVLRAFAVCDQREKPGDPDREAACNRLAGQALVPGDALSSAIEGTPNDLVASDDSLERLARRFWTSREVVLRRLRDAGRVSAATYESWKRRRDAEAKPRRPGGFAPVHRRVISRVGRPFAQLVLDAWHHDAITGSEVADYLGVNLKHLPAIERTLAAGSGSEGAA